MRKDEEMSFIEKKLWIYYQGRSRQIIVTKYYRKSVSISRYESIISREEYEKKYYAPVLVNSGAGIISGTIGSVSGIIGELSVSGERGLRELSHIEKSHEPEESGILSVITGSSIGRIGGETVVQLGSIKSIVVD
jgi:hypothetical protein